MEDSFKHLVEKCRKNEDAQIIQNASFEHAKVLVKNLLQIASDKSEKIKLVTGELRDDFYNDLTPEINACIQKNIPIEIIVLEPKKTFSNNNFFEAVNKYSQGKISQATKQVKNASHFIVVGEKRFRFEEDSVNVVAIASFNNPKIGQILNKLFEDYSKELPLKTI